jgi:putative inorganic carbon (HCO3(-)) transporter
VTRGGRLSEQEDGLPRRVVGPAVAEPTGEGTRPSPAAYLAIATLVLSIFSGHFGPLPFNRVALLGLLVTAVPRLMAGRFSPGAVHAVLGLQVVWVVGSSAWVGTLLEPVGMFAFLDEILVPLIMVVLAPVAFAGHADRLLLLRAMTLVGLYLGVMSTFQALGAAGPLFPRYLAEGLVAGEINRAGGPFLQVGGNGAALAMCIPLALLLAQSVSGAWRVLATISAAACSWGCLVTLTRSVWLACLAAFIVYFALDPRLRRWLPAFLLGTAGALGAALAVVPGLYEATFERLSTERSIDDRTTTNAAAVSMLWDHPLTGVGWARFLANVDDFVRQQDLVPLTNTHIIAHNVVLSRAAELGVIGAVLLVLAVLTGPVRAALAAPAARDAGWQRVLIAMFASWLCVAMLTPMGYPFPNYLLWAVTGLTLASWRPAASERESQPRRGAG